MTGGAVRDERIERAVRRLKAYEALVADVAAQFPSAVHDLVLHATRVCIDIVRDECATPSPNPDLTD